ncbi:MAG TPA: hypothetical protein VGM44_07030 [Polyangiaceae bacterium]
MTRDSVRRFIVGEKPMKAATWEAVRTAYERLGGFWVNAKPELV